MQVAPAMPQHKDPQHALRRWLLVFASIATCGALAAVALYWWLVAWSKSIVFFCFGQSAEESAPALLDKGILRIGEVVPIWWTGPIVVLGVGLLGALVIAIVLLIRVKSAHRVAHGVLLALLVASMIGAGWSTYRLQRSNTSLAVLTPPLCSAAMAGRSTPDELADAMVLMGGHYPDFRRPHHNPRILSILLAFSGSSCLVWLAAMRRRIRKAP